MAEAAPRTVYIHPKPARQRLRGCAAIADFIGVSRRQVHRLVDKAGLPAWREGNRGSPLLADRSELLEWLRRRREAAS